MDNDNQNAPERFSSVNYKKWILGALAVFLIIGGTFRLGYVSGKRGYAFNPKTFSVINQEDSPQTVDYDLLWQALKIVQDKYIDAGNINPQEVLYGAIRGAISAAGDDYTAFFDPKELSDFRTELQGTFSGIGAQIGHENENLVIIAPLAESPAEKAGLRAKDIIVKINGESTADMAVDVAVSKIRGPKGSEVTLTLFREGESNTFDVKIIRQDIEVKSVKLEYKDVNGKKVALVTISRFGDDTDKLFTDAVADIQKNKPAGIIVDLRNNPGGYLQSSVDVASEWLEQGKLVVSEAKSDKSTVAYNSSGANRIGGFKTLVLINGGSASAAEILAGALKDNGKATLIGEKSFGKGSVQELIPLGGPSCTLGSELNSDPTCSAVKVTVAKWITPGGKNLDKDGLEPDIKVELKSEDINAGRDPQLDRAMQEMFK